MEVKRDNWKLKLGFAQQQGGQETKLELFKTSSAQLRLHCSCGVKGCRKVRDLMTRLVQMTKIIAYVGKPQWLHTLIHLLLHYLPPPSPVSGALLSG